MSEIKPLDTLIKESFANEVQFKRVKKEVLLLKALKTQEFRIYLFTSTLGLKIQIDVTKQSIQNCCADRKNIPEKVVFELHLDKQFPFTSPKLFSRTPICFPTLADGRDLLLDVLRQSWNPSILLKDLVFQLPVFINEILTKIENKQHIDDVGSFNLGEKFDLDDFEELQDVSLYPVFELVEVEKQIERYVLISQSHFQTFDIVDKKMKILRLISVAPMQALLSIKQKLNEDRNTAILKWNDNKKDTGTIQILSTKDIKDLTGTLVKNLKKLGIGMEKNILKEPDLSLDEVTKKVVEKVKLEEILDNVNFFEEENKKCPCIQSVTGLMQAYQKAIEFYSAKNDQTFQVYMDKMKMFLQEPEIQEILKQGI